MLSLLGKIMKNKLRSLFKETWLLVTLATVIGTAALVGMYYETYVEEYKRVNAEHNNKPEVPQLGGLTFAKIDDNLYTLTGEVAQGDCEKIVPLMPRDFTVILESPGGSLHDGACLAAHFKLRNVHTVVRDTPVYNEDGKVIYQPAAAAGKGFEGRVICASACSIMFLGGDNRYLMGDVWFGIHGPATPAPYLVGKSPNVIEQQAFQTAAGLIELITQLGVEDEKLKLFFIRVPHQTMYWLKPSDFKSMPAISLLATHYRDFHGFTATHKMANLPT